jgi:hypothetical protein
MTGKPVLAASASEKVLFPDPASPVTMTRRPSADGASLIAVSVSNVPLQGMQRLLDARIAVPAPTGEQRRALLAGPGERASEALQPPSVIADHDGRQAAPATTCAPPLVQVEARDRGPPTTTAYTMANGSTTSETVTTRLARPSLQSATPCATCQSPHRRQRPRHQPALRRARSADQRVGVRASY